MRECTTQNLTRKSYIYRVLCQAKFHSGKIISQEQDHVTQWGTRLQSRRMLLKQTRKQTHLPGNQSLDNLNPRFQAIAPKTRTKAKRIRWTREGYKDVLIISYSTTT